LAGIIIITMVLLEADPFLNELTKLYERNKTSGSVWVTMKRCKLSSGLKPLIIRDAFWSLKNLT
jgi:hypothetical protein